MIVYENDCCGCAVPGYPCTGEHKRVPHYYCDECKDEKTIYEYDGRQLCIDCIEKGLEVVE